MDGETNYKKEVYMPQLKDAEEYQDFVCINLIKKGIVLSNMSSKKYQFEVGETLQGFEIKNDKIFRNSNNLYIEYEEKSDPIRKYYVKSGILRHDNTWIYAIGDYEGMYLMQKKVLIAMYKKNKFKTVETKTSRGMLLPVAEANKYFDYIKFKQ